MVTIEFFLFLGSWATLITLLSPLIASDVKPLADLGATYQSARGIILQSMPIDIRAELYNMRAT